jgi:hypothetical protein
MGLASFNRMRRQEALKELKIESETKEEVIEVIEEKKDYNEMSLLELKQIAKERKIERWSYLSKSTLVKLLTEGDK